MTSSILANRRRVPPSGIAGGSDAAPGVNRVIRADGSEVVLEATGSAEMRAGDTIVIETPGGGGFGRPAD
jgi:5-oxoprolinase (ATP-hydrolysing)